VAQGYAADAGTMPSAAFGALDAVGGSLDDALAGQATALASTQTGDLRRQALADAGPADATVSVTCAGGGSVAWTVTGGTTAQQINGQLDTGENYDIVYDQCVTAEGPTLNGRAVLDVTLRSDTADDLQITADGLTATAIGGASFVVNGDLRNQRTRTALDNGRSLTSRFTSNQLMLASTIGSRQANYTLQALDWTVTRVRDGAGQLTARSHEGSLQLAARTPRRPDATLEVATNGALQVAEDGYFAEGTLALSNALNSWTVTWSLPSTVTVAYDAGKDGTVNRSWTLTRQSLLGLAG
jgi:hypothetical protein